MLATSVKTTIAPLIGTILKKLSPTTIMIMHHQDGTTFQFLPFKHFNFSIYSVSFEGRHHRRTGSSVCKVLEEGENQSLLKTFPPISTLSTKYMFCFLFLGGIFFLFVWFFPPASDSRAFVRNVMFPKQAHITLLAS